MFSTRGLPLDCETLRFVEECVTPIIQLQTDIYIYIYM